MVLLVLLCASVFACQKKGVKLQAEAVLDRKLMPVLEAEEVSTLISDSGIIRYRIEAAKWLVYDKADTPYWEFPEGVYLEKFNQSQQAFIRKSSGPLQLVNQGLHGPFSPLSPFYSVEFGEWSVE